MDPNLIQRFSRREFVQRFGTAMAGVSLSGIFQGEKVFAAPASALADYTNPLTPRGRSGRKKFSAPFANSNGAASPASGAPTPSPTCRNTWTRWQ